MLDLNVVLDLKIGQILEALSRLPAELHLVDVAADRLGVAWTERLIALGVRITSISGKGVRRAAWLADQFRRPSTDDLYSLALAEELGATLVTGDKDLRAAATGSGQVPHGTVWLLEELVRTSTLMRHQAADALESMLQAGRRLPADEANKRIVEWRER